MFDSDSFKKKKKILFIYLLGWVLCCCVGPSLAVASGGYSLVSVLRLLTVVTCLVVEYRLQSAQAQ